MNIYYVYLSVVHIFSVHKIRNLKGVLCYENFKINLKCMGKYVGTYVNTTYNILYYKNNTKNQLFKKKVNKI